MNGGRREGRGDGGPRDGRLGAVGPTPEFPAGADLPPGALSRRRFLELVGGSMALAGASGCVPRPPDEIVPYAHRPPEVTPGVPAAYATATVLDGYATGLLVQTREGRPIKVEGNPDHPASLGAAGVFEQAALLGLYDPSRLRDARREDGPASWGDLERFFADGPGGARRDGGAGLALLLEPTSSPLRADLLAAVRRRWPRAGVWFHAPGEPRAELAAAAELFGAPRLAEPDLGRAAVVVALGSDLLAAGPFHLRHARRFALRRRIFRPEDPMSRFYAAEPMPTPTGSLADHRLRARPSELPRLALALYAAVGGAGAPRVALEEPQRAWVAAAARDLAAHRGRGVVVAGAAAPAGAHLGAALVNAALGNAGRTVGYREPPVLEAGRRSHRLEELARRMAAGRVDTLVILEGNPAYSAPADVPFAELLGRVPATVYLGLHENETARRCRWVVPALHTFESWGDARAFDGTATFVQPLVRPLFGGHTVDEALALLAGLAVRDGRELLRESWRRRRGFGGGGAGSAAPAAAGDVEVHGGVRVDRSTGAPESGPFADFWRAALRRGFLPDTATPAAAASPRAAGAALARIAAETRDDDSLELSFRTDPGVHDGRFASNPWLLELPRPVTKLSWGNAALMSPRTAGELGVETEDLVDLVVGERRVRAPVFTVPGHADRTITVSLGFGRTAGAGPGTGVGFDAYRVRPAAHLGNVSGVAVERVRVAPEGPWRIFGAADRPARQRLADTQHHWSVEGRPIVLEATLEDYRRHRDFAAEQQGEPATLYDGPPLDAAEQWAMTIDLSLCTGCSACVVACQAENNLPTVGKQGVLDGREMYWLRIDRYLKGSGDDPEIVHQPMLCQHCERAPCEYVCPVNATVHSADGLNEMIYNRCVGTRFCSNNCPYKVRRFNWLDYNAPRGPLASMVLNPDVTVRERGVMEKCTYCVQRIRRAGIAAQVEDRPLADGDVVTACQQACPTEAIVFGSLTDPASRVARSRRSPRAYQLLHELGTRPRTRYLARIANPEPGLHRRTLAEVRRERPAHPHAEAKLGTDPRTEEP